MITSSRLVSLLQSIWKQKLRARSADERHRLIIIKMFRMAVAINFIRRADLMTFASDNRVYAEHTSNGVFHFCTAQQFNFKSTWLWFYNSALYDSSRMKYKPSPVRKCTVMVKHTALLGSSPMHSSCNLTYTPTSVYGCAVQSVFRRLYMTPHCSRQATDPHPVNATSRRLSRALSECVHTLMKNDNAYNEAQDCCSWVENNWEHEIISLQYSIFLQLFRI